MHIFKRVILLLPILAALALADEKLDPLSQMVQAPLTDINFEMLPECQRNAMSPMGHKQDYRGLTPKVMCREYRPYHLLWDTKNIMKSCNITTKEEGEVYADRSKKWWISICGRTPPADMSFCKGWMLAGYLCREHPLIPPQYAPPQVARRLLGSRLGAWFLRE